MQLCSSALSTPALAAPLGFMERGKPLPLPRLGCEYGEVMGQGDNEIAVLL